MDGLVSRGGGARAAFPAFFLEREEFLRERSRRPVGALTTGHRDRRRQYAPRPETTAGMVFMRMIRSISSDQLST